MEQGRVGKNSSCLLEAEGFAIEAGGWSKLVSKVDAGEERRDVDVHVLEGGGTGVWREEALVVWREEAQVVWMEEALVVGEA